MQWEQDSELTVDQLVNEYDDTFMPLPNIELEPHLLISKVRKHYMDYMIKLLAVNYENSQKLLHKNIYLPSAIWRCAKNIEMAAAQACMVVQMYRKNVLAVIQDLKNDTKKGKLNKKLYECLNKPPENDKKLQVSFSKSDECICQCTCTQQKRRRKISPQLNNQNNNLRPMKHPDMNLYKEEYKIPVVINAKNNQPELCLVKPLDSPKTEPVSDKSKQPNDKTLGSNVRMSIESQDSDDLLLQLERLFQEDPNDDDLFDGTVSGDCTTSTVDVQNAVQKNDKIIETHTAQIRSLDARLASLPGLLVQNIEVTTSQQKTESVKNNKKSGSKWLCEEYYLKKHLFELLDQVRENNRMKLSRIKTLILDLFGDDSDDEGVISPLDETPEFEISCKERIALWVVKLLTPYYIKGRIKGKALFKSLAKHLMSLIYQCSRYPQENEVHHFVSDFLSNHRMIRCEADFKQFRIENI